jgi:DNA polymerase III subunit delta
MAPLTTRALRSALEKGAFDPAYLFHGDNDYLKEEKARTLVERATDAGTRDFNFDTRRGGDVEVRDLTQILDSAPLMAERRVLVIRDAGALKKAPRATLLSYLERPSSDVVVLLVQAAGSKLDEMLASKASAVEFRHLTEQETLAWAAAHCASVGVDISAETLALLCAATGNDMALLVNEVAKLASFTDGGEITARAVAEVVGVQHGETMTDLLDAVAARDGVRAAALVPRILAQPKTTAVSVLMVLTTQMLAMAWVLAAKESGTPQHALERELFHLLRETSAFVGRPWGEAIKVWVRASSSWDSRTVGEFILRLAMTETGLKDTRVSSDEHVLSTLALSVGSARLRRAA